MTDLNDHEGQMESLLFKPFDIGIFFLFVSNAALEILRQIYGSSDR